MINFLKIFYFEVDKSLLAPLGRFKAAGNKIEFSGISDSKAQRKFNMLLSHGFTQLRNRLNNKPTVYIHKNSGIPLIGNVGFGLVDRDTNIIEVKPITGCNLECIYCSVDEDKRPVDFVIEEEYLADEFRKLVLFKEADNIEAHIASQGEPLLYTPLTSLIKDISKIKQVKLSL